MAIVQDGQSSLRPRDPLQLSSQAEILERIAYVGHHPDRNADARPRTDLVLTLRQSAATLTSNATFTVDAASSSA